MRPDAGVAVRADLNGGLPRPCVHHHPVGRRLNQRLGRLRLSLDRSAPYRLPEAVRHVGADGPHVEVAAGAERGRAGQLAVAYDGGGREAVPAAEVGAQLYQRLVAVRGDAVLLEVADEGDADRGRVVARRMGSDVVEPSPLPPHAVPVLHDVVTHAEPAEAEVVGVEVVDGLGHGARRVVTHDLGGPRPWDGERLEP